jgi:hypothetical protein
MWEVKIRWDFKRWVQDKFFDQIDKCRICVVWKDIDGQTKAWIINADDKEGLEKMSYVIDYAKKKKLEDITGVKGDDDDTIVSL